MNAADFAVLLARVRPGVVPVRASGARAMWTLPSTRIAAPLRVTLDGVWATMQASAAPCATHDALATQSRWPTDLKCVEGADGYVTRAEMPLTVDSASGRAWITRQVRHALESIEHAAAGLQPKAAPAVAPPARDSLDSLVPLFEQAGWSTVRKGDNGLRVDTSVRGTPRAATLRVDEDGLHVSLDLEQSLVAQACATRLAAARSLLTHANASLRWVRAGLDGGASPRAGFECFVAAPPHPAAVLCATDALFVACETFGDEIELLLESASLAALYLARTNTPGTAPEPDSENGTVAARPGPSHPAAQPAFA